MFGIFLEYETLRLYDALQEMGMRQSDMEVNAADRAAQPAKTISRKLAYVFTTLLASIFPA